MAIDISRVTQKLDSYYDRNDTDGALRHLKYWYSEAESQKDDRALLFLTNELTGFFRKQGDEEKALGYAQKALGLIKEMDIADTAGGATTLINSATAYKAFGKAQEAIPLFIKAEEIYKKVLSPEDERLAGLYNNMALAYTDINKYRKAEELYNKALEITKDSPDAAITCLNLADLAEKEKGTLGAQEETDSLLEKAWSILDKNRDQEDGYYAYVCEKCAAVFGYYGYFLYEQELKERAEKIYERA